MKKTLFILGGVVLVALAYYAISPLFNNTTLDEEVPENVVSDSDAEDERMPSGAENLSEEERAEMEAQTAAANETDMPPMDEQLPEAEEAASRAEASYEVMGTIGHPASGSVRVLKTTDGSAVVRYENLSTINGPNIHVYLAKDLDAEEYIDLGPIKATDGNINYPVPPGVDVSEYRYVMHWCVPFSVLFNYADTQ